MSASLERINKELNENLKLQNDIEFRCAESSMLIPQQELERRIYYKKINILNKYIGKIREMDIRVKNIKRGVFGIFKDDTMYLNELLDYKNDIKEDLNKLKTCSKCKCLECSLVCEFKACMKCDPNIRVSTCDKERFNVTQGYKNITLYLDDNPINYEVIGILEDNELNKRYIYLSEIDNINNQQLLEYKEYLDGKEEFNGIEGEEFNRVWNQFLKFDICR